MFRWTPCNLALPIDTQLVWVTGDSGYSQFPRFNTTAYLDRVGRPWKEGEKPRWMDVTGTSLSDYGWDPTHWSIITENTNPIWEIKNEVRRRFAIADLSAINLARCARWHQKGVMGWSPEKWFTATAGELGEAGNALKKLFRIEEEMANINEPGRDIQTKEEAIKKIGEEVADTFIYLNLFALRLGIDLAQETIDKFNATSEKYGFPERL